MIPSDNQIQAIVSSDTICIDVETKDPLLLTHGPGCQRGDSHICGVGVGSANDLAFYLPLDHPDMANDHALIARNKRIIQTILTSGKYLLGANIAYDLEHLIHEGFTVNTDKLHDVQYAEPLLNEYAISYNLNNLAKKYTRYEKKTNTLTAYCDSMGWKGKLVSHLWEMPSAIVEEYAVADITLPLEIFAKQKALLEAEGLLSVYTMETQLIPTLLRMRKNGVRLNIPLLHKTVLAFADKKYELELGLYDWLGGELNLGSSAQLAARFDALGIMYPRRQPTELMKQKGKPGNPLLDKGALTNIAKEHPKALELLKYRHYDTLESMFFKPYLDFQVGDRLHGTFHPLRSDDYGTVSGRFSCVAKGTMITTLNGERAIEDIVAGDIVLTHKNRHQTVIETQIKGDERMYDVHLSNGKTITCTREHRFLTTNGWRRLDEVVTTLDKKSRTEEGSPEAILERGKTGDDKGDSSACLCARKDNREDNSAGSPKGVPSGSCKHVVRCDEDGRAKPNEREEWREAPLVQGGLPRRKGLSDKSETREGEQKNLHAPRCYGRILGPTQSSGKVRHSPHRWEQNEQRDRQSNVGNNDGTLKTSRSIDPHCEQIEITNIYKSDVQKVYDITVKEDHSYVASGVFNHNCSRPNLQQVSAIDEEASDDEDELKGRILRAMFIPEEGCQWAKLDYSQIEYRIMIHYSKGDAAERLRTAYNADATTDMHQSICNLTGFDRRTAKRLNFGGAYGMGIETAANLFGWTIAEATLFMNGYHNAAPYVKTLRSMVTAAAARKGSIYTLLGRKARTHKSRKLHAMFNRLIQGGAADVMKKAIVDCEKSGVFDEVTLHMTVHDELDCSYKEDSAGREALAEIKKTMEDTVKLSVPLLVDCHTGANWADAD